MEKLIRNANTLSKNKHIRSSIETAHGKLLDHD